MGCACGIGREAFSTTYNLGPALGRGAFGEVRMANKVGSEQKLAVKIIWTGSEQGKLNTARRHRAKNEALLMHRVKDCMHCVRVVDFLPEAFRCYLVMELCGPSLLEKMKAAPSFIDGNYACIVNQMLLAISYCHRECIVHRDVKPENFLFGGADRKTLKLCDFGSAETIRKQGHLTGVYGTAPYMAPEVVSRAAYTDRVDVWSVGVVAYQMSFKHFPYMPGRNGSQAMKDVIREGCPSPFFTSDERGSFLQKLMERSKQHRCSALEALQSTFLQSISGECVIEVSKPQASE
eukprot:TRINITY_DN67275_c0_g1_i1.p1 TRINITY_DN67275_c0_g1~~TRINITY_DN67275_c0_g1_i1.p1  ORF type:complete len:292 (-),score=26.04 TRINITY_DN67275_c0_g1_i1:483-1358(-)